eukprot:1160370-Pelagomonas_calceolata.AAC.5
MMNFIIPYARFRNTCMPDLRPPVPVLDNVLTSDSRLADSCGMRYTLSGAGHRSGKIPEIDRTANS